MKTDRVIEDIAKTKAKIAELQTRLRELERRKTDIENTEIVELMRGVAARPEELAAFIEAYKQQGGMPTTPANTTNTEQEEPPNEE